MNHEQLAFAFLDDLSARYHSEAERRFALGLARSGWFEVSAANDNSRHGMTWRHPQFRKTELFYQLDLFPLIGVEHRVDFCFRSRADVARCLIVEIDGQAFHSSPLQIGRDKRLDRAIQSVSGWSVFRYPAREVLDRRLCDQSIRMIHAVLTRWSRAPLGRAS